MARNQRLLGEDFTDLLKRNGTLLTGFAVLLIVVSGVTIIDNPSKWWVSILSVVGFFTVIFLFMNARVLIKAAIALFLLSFLGSYAFKLGALFDPVGLGGSFWMTSFLAAFFVSLAISYIKPSGKSRWGVAGLTAVVNFGVTLLVASLGAPIRWTALGSAIMAVVLFCLIYFYGKNSRFNTLGMPLLSLSEDDAETIRESALETGRGGWVREVKGNNSVVVWNDETAFQLMEVELERKFGVGASRRTTFLTHDGNNLNPWLLSLVYRMLPLRGVRGADLMLVLLDVNNKNGDQPKVIGVAIPDSKKKIPVGILPAKNLLSPSKAEKLFSTIEREFGEYALKLSEKQVEALDAHLPDPEEAADAAEENVEENLDSSSAKEEVVEEKESEKVAP